MYRLMQQFRLLGVLLPVWLSLPLLCAADSPSPVESNAAPVSQSAASTLNSSPASSETVALVTSPDLIEHLVDVLLERFGLNAGGNTPSHWGVFAAILLGSIILRRYITKSLFFLLGRIASKTTTTLDDRLFKSLESPLNALILVLGTFMALKVLKLPEQLDVSIGYLYKLALPTVIFWAVINSIDEVVEHLGKLAHDKGMGIAAFLPLIKKTVIGVFIILAILTIIQSFGYDVKTFLAGLGIGGLAVALAAQDTIANLFGSFIVAIDQPFKVGDFVRIGSLDGTVEDIGMRSTKLRTSARTLIAIPNRTVANDPVTNFSRMPQRRVDQIIGLTYDTSIEKMNAVLEDIRSLLKEDPAIHEQLIVANFVNYGASSLDIQIVYFTSDPDWAKHMQTRENVNLKIMEMVARRGLSFAFPTQTVNFDGEIAKGLLGARAQSPAQ